MASCSRNTTDFRNPNQKSINTPIPHQVFTLARRLLLKVLQFLHIPHHSVGMTGTDNYIAPGIRTTNTGSEIFGTWHRSEVIQRVNSL